MIVAASDSSEHLQQDRQRRERVAVLTQYAIASGMGIVLFLIAMVTR